MTTKQQTSKEYFRTMRIMHFALIAGLLFFCLIVLVLFLNKLLDPIDELTKNLFLGVLVILSGGMLLAGNLIFKKRLQTAKSKMTLIEKMADYRSITILRYATIEGPAFFAIILTFLTNDLLFLAISVLFVTYLAILKPTMERAIRDLELNHKEQELINDPNAVIAEIMVGR